MLIQNYIEIVILLIYQSLINNFTYNLKLRFKFSKQFYKIIKFFSYSNSFFGFYYI